MGKTRCQRRAIAKERRIAKLVRLARASEAADLDKRRAIVLANLGRKPELRAELAISKA